MEHLKETKIASKEIFKGKIINLRVDTVKLPNGKEATREVVEHPGAVAVVALNEKNELVMIHQFRAPINEVIIEIPAGKLEKGEDPLVCAKRELEEETGYQAASWKQMFTFYTTPGFSDEKMYLYMAKDLKSLEQSLDEDEFVELVYIPVKDALDMARNGKIKDAKTILGIEAASLFLHS